MMPTPTYVPLATITLASTDSEIVLSSIAASYRDLIVVINGASTATSLVALRFNSDTTTAYSYVLMLGNGSSSDSASASSQDEARIGVYWSTPNVTVTQVMDYSATNKHKTILSRSNNAANRVSATASRWANTDAVHTVTVVNDVSTFTVGTTISIYGVN
jgi:hypothetical protein